MAVTSEPATVGRYRTAVVVVASRDPSQSRPMRQSAKKRVNTPPAKYRVHAALVEYGKTAMAVGVTATLRKCRLRWWLVVVQTADEFDEVVAAAACVANCLALDRLTSVLGHDRSPSLFDHVVENTSFMIWCPPLLVDTKCLSLLKEGGAGKRAANGGKDDPFRARKYKNGPISQEPR
jgi:hypothetical protein